MKTETLPYRRVKIGIRVTHTVGECLRSAGALVQQTRDDQRLNERHAQAARALGQDPFQLGRQFDDRPMASTGKPIFGVKGISNVSLTHLVGQDLSAAGYSLESTTLYQTDKDAELGRWTFQMWFAPGSELRSTLQEEAAPLLMELLIQSRHIKVFDNRGSYETAAIDTGLGDKINNKTKKLRMAPDGTFHLEDPVPTQLQANP